MIKAHKCSRCNKAGHNAGTCALRSALPPLTALEALRTMIDPHQAVALIATGSVGEALSNATRGLAEARQIGLDVGNAIPLALAELERRSRDISPDLIEAVRRCQADLAVAAAAYTAAVAAITVQLGYGDEP